MIHYDDNSIQFVSTYVEWCDIFETKIYARLHRFLFFLFQFAVSSQTNSIWLMMRWGMYQQQSIDTSKTIELQLPAKPNWTFTKYTFVLLQFCFSLCVWPTFVMLRLRIFGAEHKTKSFAYAVGTRNDVQTSQ